MSEKAKLTEDEFKVASELLIADLLGYIEDKFKEDLVSRGYRRDLIEACMSNKITKPVVK